MTDDEISVQFATYAERNLDWPRRTIFRRSVNALVAIGHALLAIHVELRRLNDGRDQFHREVLDVLSASKSGDVSSLRSEQPAAAPDGQEGGTP